jgi:Na+/phosphate symporter
MKRREQLGTIFLAIWLILSGLVSLLSLDIPQGGTILAVLALVTGILLIAEIRSAVGRNLGRLLLGIYLILLGLIPILNLTLPGDMIILAVLASAAGILLLLGR